MFSAVLLGYIDRVSWSRMKMKAEHVGLESDVQGRTRGPKHASMVPCRRLFAILIHNMSRCACSSSLTH